MSRMNLQPCEADDVQDESTTIVFAMLFVCYKGFKKK